MKSLGVLFAFALGQAGCSTSQASNASAAGSAFTAADSSAIVAMIDRLQAAGQGNNWDAWVAEYTPTAVRQPPNAKALNGKAEIDAFNHAFPKVTAFNVAVTSIIGRSDLATASGTFTLSTSAAPGVPAGSDEGKWMSVAMKQPDGSWKTIRDTWNSDKPLPTAPPAKK
jgi:ketosteroid isomerase-like protein